MKRNLESSFSAFASDLSYLKPAASAAWTPEFGTVLSTSSTMRERKITKEEKEAHRGFSGACMACGRREHTCEFVIDLAGSFDSSAWQSVSDVQGAYFAFCKAEERHYTKDRKGLVIGDDGLAACDRGTFVVGSTCLRKAKLQFGAQVMVMECCYSAERVVEDAAIRAKKPLKRSKLYTVNNAEAEALLYNKRALERAVADERCDPPKVPTEPGFWKLIDATRAALPNGIDIAFRRASGLMDHAHRASLDGYSRVCDYESGNKRPRSTEPPDCPVEAQRVDGIHLAKRIALVDDDSSDDEHGDCGNAAAPAAALAPTAAPTAAPTVAPTVAPAPTAASTAPAAAPAVQDQLCEAAVSESRKSLAALMQLQLKLWQSGQMDDAAICSSAIVSVQNLIKSVHV